MKTCEQIKFSSIHSYIRYYISVNCGQPTPWSLYLRGKRPGVYSSGDWLGFRAVLERPCLCISL